MNHLIDILQLSTQEIDELVEKAKDIIANPRHMPTSATVKFWPRSSLSPQPVQD